MNPNRIVWAFLPLLFLSSSDGQQPTSPTATNSTATNLASKPVIDLRPLGEKGATNPAPIINPKAIREILFDSLEGISKTESLEETRAKAEKGNPLAQFTLGSCYTVGQGVPQDYVEAAKWHRKAAEQGLAVAQVHVGFFYYNGYGVVQDYTEAVNWCRKAAEQDNAIAKWWLGLVYTLGNGVPQDYIEAAKWYRKAAEQGNILGQSALANCYREGRGVPKDEREAAEWDRKVGENRDQAPVLIFILRSNAEQGEVHSQLALGIACYSGYGVPQDYAEAAKWFRRAADQGKSEAQTYLGRCYENGFGVPRDAVEAVKWYRKAAEHGDAEAQNRLGMAYVQTLFGGSIDALGLPRDYGQAVGWFRRAANQGDLAAHLALGKCYWEGRGVPKNRIEAYKWLNIAAAQSGADGARIEAVEATAKARDELAATMTNEEIAEAQRLSATFVPRREGEAAAKSDDFFEVVTMKSGRIYIGRVKNETDKELLLTSPHDEFLVIGKSQIQTRTRAGTPNEERPRSLGTGFFITEDGFLVTNEHVVKEAAKVRLVTSTGLIAAVVVKVDAANDLALLKADGRLTPLPVVSSRSMRLGSSVATVGFPNIGLQGFAPKLAKGEIAALTGAQADPRYFQISVPVQPGNSGGALVDERGNVVGVVSAKLNASVALTTTGALPENVNYAVKSSFLLSFLESVPEVAAKLKEPNTRDRKFEDVVKSAEQAAVLVLVY